MDQKTRIELLEWALRHSYDSCCYCTHNPDGDLSGCFRDECFWKFDYKRLAKMKKNEEEEKQWQMKTEQ